jgi:hypothetical protein
VARVEVIKLDVIMQAEEVLMGTRTTVTIHETGLVLIHRQVPHIEKEDARSVVSSDTGLGSV